MPSHVTHRFWFRRWWWSINTGSLQKSFETILLASSILEPSPQVDDLAVRDGTAHVGVVEGRVALIQLEVVWVRIWYGSPGLQSLYDGGSYRQENHCAGMDATGAVMENCPLVQSRFCQTPRRCLPRQDPRPLHSRATGLLQSHPPATSPTPSFGDRKLRPRPTGTFRNQTNFLTASTPPTTPHTTPTTLPPPADAADARNRTIGSQLASQEEDPVSPCTSR